MSLPSAGDIFNTLDREHPERSIGLAEWLGSDRKTQNIMDIIRHIVKMEEHTRYMSAWDYIESFGSEKKQFAKDYFKYMCSDSGTEPEVSTKPQKEIRQALISIWEDGLSVADARMQAKGIPPASAAEMAITAAYREALSAWVSTHRFLPSDWFPATITHNGVTKTWEFLAPQNQTTRPKLRVAGFQTIGGRAETRSPIWTYLRLQLNGKWVEVGFERRVE